MRSILWSSIPLEGGNSTGMVSEKQCACSSKKDLRLSSILDIDSLALLD